jgi:hypothetical protein
MISATTKLMPPSQRTDCAPKDESPFSLRRAGTTASSIRIVAKPKAIANIPQTKNANTLVSIFLNNEQPGTMPDCHFLIIAALVPESELLIHTLSAKTE